MKYSYFFSVLLTFLLIVGLSNWAQIQALLASRSASSSILERSENIQVNAQVAALTQQEISVALIASSSKTYGMMIGLPGRPQMVLSQGLVDQFTPLEREYVILHEYCHYQRQHSVKEALLTMVFCLLAVTIVLQFAAVKRVVVAMVISIFFAGLLIQIGKLHELEADRFTLSRLSDPQGMIQATHKLQANNPARPDGMVEFLLFRSLPYHYRIEMAELEIEKRQ